MITQSGSIRAVPLEQTAPPALERDEKTAALVKALAKLLQENANLIYDTIGVYYRIAALDEKTLDILAADLHADWYDYDGPLEEKRRLIANDIMIHRGMGTVAMLRRVLESIHGDCAVEEWFSYGGEPYYFRVAINVTDPEEAISHGRIINAIKTYKPVRAHLEEENIAYRSAYGFLLRDKAEYVVYDVRRAGTYPANAAQGEKNEAAIHADGEAAGTAYAAPLCGESL